jgi:hypothetical protein
MCTDEPEHSFLWLLDDLANRACSQKRANNFIGRLSFDSLGSGLVEARVGQL